MTAFALAPLQDRAQSIQTRLSKLFGQMEALRQREQELREQIAFNRAQLIQGPLATSVLQELQKRAHQRAVGGWEDQLTAIVQDVYPEAGQVKLLLGTRNGASTLDIKMSKCEGLNEDLVAGTGGGVTNVVTTGLIYAAIERAKLRPFVLLDEPDHWMFEGRVPAFTRVIADVAQHLNIQTVMISHKGLEYLDDSIHIIELRKNADGVLEAHPLNHAEPWPDDETPGVRWMELEYIRGHVKTRYDLPPGATAIIGDNNLGKSAGTISPWQAVAYNESDDDLIYHLVDQATNKVLYKAPEGRIRIGLENGFVVELIRKRDGTPKVLYRIYQHGKQIFEGRPLVRGINGVPPEIVQLLNIRHVEGLDVALRHQKDPPFLLREPDTVRAKILSIGREASHLTDWLKEHRAVQSSAARSVEIQEQELADIVRKNKVLAGLNGFDTIQAALTGMVADLANGLQRRDLLQDMIARLEKLEAFDNVLAQVEDMKPLALPEIKDTRALESLVNRLQRLELLNRLPAAPAPIVMPEIQDTAALAAMIDRLQRLSNQATVFGLLPENEVALPEIKDTQPLITMGLKITRLLQQQEQLDKELLQVASEIPVLEARKEALRIELGVCPFCDQAMVPDHGHHVKSPAPEHHVTH